MKLGEAAWGGACSFKEAKTLGSPQNTELPGNPEAKVQVLHKLATTREILPKTVAGPETLRSSLEHPAPQEGKIRSPDSAPQLANLSPPNQPVMH